jgi:hypothetical protein
MSLYIVDQSGKDRRMQVANGVLEELSFCGTLKKVVDLCLKAINDY